MAQDYDQLPENVCPGPMIVPVAEEEQAEGSPGWFSGMQDLVGNSGILDLVGDPSLLVADMSGAGGAPGYDPRGGGEGAPGWEQPPETEDPVQAIIDAQLAKHSDKERPEQLKAAISDTSAYRRANDPDNKDEDWAAADHYIYGRKMTVDMADGVGDALSPYVGEEVADTAGAVAGTLGGLGVGLVLVPGYDAYKAVGYGMKDAGEFLGWDGLANTGTGMLTGVTNGELPSRPTLRSMGWGMQGAAEGIGDGWGAAWDSWTTDRRKEGDMSAWK